MFSTYLLNHRIITNLHFYRLAVDKFHAGHQAVKNDRCLLARVDDDRVDLSFHGDSRVCALEQVHYVVHLDVVHNQTFIAFLVFNEPLLAITDKAWGFVYSWGGISSGIALGRFEGSWSLPKSWIFMGLHVGGYFLQT